METALFPSAFLGVLVGLVLALTGAGGGTLAVPVLMFALHLGIAQAAPIALLAVAPAATLGAVMALRTARLRYRAAALMSVLGLVGAPIGLWLAQALPNRPLTAVFALLIGVTSLRMLRASARSPATRAGGAAGQAACSVDAATGRLHWTAACARVLGGAGLLAGICSSMLGVGGGFVIVPALARVTDLDMESITATSLAVIAIVSAASIALIWGSGQTIAWPIAIPFVAGTMAGLVAGRRIAHQFSTVHLKRIFAILMLIVALLLVLRSLT